MSSIVIISVIVLASASCTEDRGIRAQSEIRTSDGGSSIESTADDGSNGAVVFVPSNSDVDPADVRVEEGAYVAKDVTASYLTVPGKVTPVSAAIGFYSEVAFTSKQMSSIVLTIPIDFELAKNVENFSKDKLAVFYHVYTSELGDEGAMQFGVIPSSMIEVIEAADGGIALSFAVEKIQVNGRGFGVYQLANFVLDSGDELIIEKSRSTHEAIKRADGSKISIAVTPKAGSDSASGDESRASSDNSAEFSNIRNSTLIDRERNWSEAISKEVSGSSYGSAPDIMGADGAADGSFIVAIAEAGEKFSSAGGVGEVAETIRILRIKNGVIADDYSVARNNQNYVSKIFVDHKGGDNYVVAVCTAGMQMDVIFGKEGGPSDLHSLTELESTGTCSEVSLAATGPESAVLMYRTGGKYSFYNINKDEFELEFSSETYSKAWVISEDYDEDAYHLVAIAQTAVGSEEKIEISSFGFEWSTDIPKSHIMNAPDFYLNHAGPGFTADGSIVFNYTNSMSGKPNEEARIISYTRGEFSEQAVPIDPANYFVFNDNELVGKNSLDLVLFGANNANHVSSFGISHFQGERWQSVDINLNLERYENTFYHLSNSLFSLDLNIDTAPSDDDGTYKVVHSINKIDLKTGDVIEESVIASREGYFTAGSEMFLMAPNGEALLIYTIGTEPGLYLSVYR